MHTIKWNIFLALGLFLLGSCNEEAVLTDRIPAEMEVVVKADANRLGGKVLWDKIKNTDWGNVWKKDGSSDETEPENEETGIDILSDMYAGVRFADNSKEACGALFFNLSDARKFEQFLLKKSPGAQIDTEGDYKIIRSEHKKGKVSVLFRDDFAVVLLAKRETGFADFQNKIINLETDESLTNDEDFALATSGSADISGRIEATNWLNKADDLQGIAEENGLGKMHFSLDFEEGEINFKNQIFAEDKFLAGFREAADKLQVPHPGEKDKVLQFMQIALPSAFTESLVEKFAGLKSRAFLMSAGLTAEQLTAAFDGQAAMSIGPGKTEKSERITYTFDDNFNKIEKKETVDRYRPDLRLEVFGNEALAKLPAAYERNGVLKKNEAGLYTASFFGYEVFMKYGDNRLGISTSGALFSDDNRNELSDLAAKYPFVFFINDRKFEESADDFLKMLGSKSAVRFDRPTGIFESGLLTGEAADNHFLFKGKYKLINTDENSLFVLLDAAKESMENKENL